MNKLALNTVEKAKLKKLMQKSFYNMTNDEREVFLKLGAKDFSRRFGKTIEKLANE